MVRRAVAAVGAVSLLWFLTPLARAQEPPPAGFAATIRVPNDVATIQAAVDRVEPGGMVLIAPGVYDEQVTVTTPFVTIRGEDRNKTIVDGGGARDMAIEVDGANGVVIQNLSVRSALLDGISWNDVDGFWASYVTAYDNGRDGIVATGSSHGQVDHVFAGGNAEAGVAIVGCDPCGTVVSEVTATGNAAGFSGSNAGGDLSVVNGEWYGNGTGIVLTTVDDIAGAPQRSTIVAGNSVHDNDEIGIVVRGGSGNLIAENLVEDSSNYGIALLPTLDHNLWVSGGNAVRDNLVRRSGVADLALGAPAGGGDCFSGNDATTSQPPAAQDLLPCEGVRIADAGGSFAPTITAVADAVSGTPPSIYVPAPPAQEQMQGDPVDAPPIIAAGGQNVPQRFTIRPAGEIQRAQGPTVSKKIAIMGVPLATSWGELLIGIYGYILPFVLFATWMAVAMWDLIRQESAPMPHRARWMLIVLIVPFIGPLLYFAFGRSPIPRQLRLVLTAGGIVAYLLFLSLGVLVS
jgi:parallel beta-helix repeat protein